MTEGHMSTYKMVENVYWVGAIDWSVRIFHGYHTDEGSSYNAYLIMDEEFPTLVDTVKAPFANELLERIQALTPLDSIKYVLMQHAENDHTGALPIIMRHLPNATIVANAVCQDHLCRLYPSLPQYNWMIVDGSTPLKLKTHTLAFVPIPYLHWPDSMISYCPEIKTLFSNDGFGQHIASSERFSDQLKYLDHVIKLMREYNANILGPFQKQIARYLPVALQLEITHILTAHGVSWRNSHILIPIQEYQQFGENKQIRNKVSIIFNSMNGEIKKAAEFLAAHCDFQISFLDLEVNDLTKIALQAYDSKFLAFLSPNLNGQMMPRVESALQYLRGLNMLRGRKIFAIASYYWSEKVLPQMRAIVEQGRGHMVFEMAFKAKFGQKQQQQILEAIEEHWVPFLDDQQIEISNT